MTEDLDQPTCVGLDFDRLPRKRNDQFLAACIDLRLNAFDRLVHDPGELHDFFAQANPTLGHAGHVDQVIDQLAQVLNLLRCNFPRPAQANRSAGQRRMSSSEFWMGASGLRSSCASAARNSFLWSRGSQPD